MIAVAGWFDILLTLFVSPEWLAGCERAKRPQNQAFARVGGAARTTSK
jgi:hypothetical protein